MKKLKILVDLCLFQAKPQDFPYSPAWAVISAIALWVGIYVSYPGQEFSSLVIAWISIIHIAVYAFAIWGALWFRMHPENARFLMYVGQGIGLLGIVTVISGGQSGMQAGIYIVLAAAYTVVLSATFRNRPSLEQAVSRFVQTISTIFGTATLLQLATWPFINWLAKIPDSGDASIPFLAIVALGFWTFAVAVNINRHAMEVSTGQSILITLGAQILTAFVVFTLFGAAMI